MINIVYIIPTSLNTSKNSNKKIIFLIEIILISVTIIVCRIYILIIRF